MSTPTIGMQIANAPQSVGLGLTSVPQSINCGLVIALNVVDLDNYVSKEELRKMNVMTWGNELQEGDNNA